VPATSNVPDRRITFMLKAPDAAGVQVAGGDGLGPGQFPMTKGTDGTWSVTTPPRSETYFGYGKETSGVEVPEAGADFYAIQNVPHGEVRYTPAGYDEHLTTRYPVLILQHGHVVRRRAESDQFGIGPVPHRDWRRCGGPAQGRRALGVLRVKRHSARVANLATRSE